MNKTLLFITFLACIACAEAADNLGSSVEKPITYEVSVSGRVTSNGTPIAGAVISDGVEVTQTDSEGNYTLLSPDRMGYVFISTPSGYRVDNRGIIPQHYINVKGKRAENVNFELKPMPNDYTLFVMADMHLIGDSQDKDLEQFCSTFLPDIIQEIENTKGEVVTISLGDMTTDTRWYSNNFSFPQYLSEFKGYPTPIYHIMGNHDNDPQAVGGDDKEFDWSAAAPYKRYIGPNYYSLNIGDVHYVMLDNIVAVGRYKYQYWVDPVQLEWIKRDIALVDKSTPIVVSMHVPAYIYTGIGDNGELKTRKRTTEHQDVDEILDLFNGFKEVHILTGHDHRNRNVQIRDNILEHNFVSGSAISWKINHPNSRIMANDGTLSGYQIFEVNGKNVTWAYKAVGREVVKSQFRLYDLNTIPAEHGGKPGSNEILINVFNWDPEWTVSVSESGKALNVTQLWAKDPLYALIRANPASFPTRPTAWLAVNTEHMFGATATSSNSEIVVTVTDRFGIEYKETLSRPKALTWDMD